eukprot:2438352-Ditylum_brightwellii.AAC.1
MERIQMMKNTKKFEAQHKEYKQWQEKIFTCLENQQMNIDRKFNTRAVKIDGLECTMKKQGAMLETLVAGVNAVMTKTATTEHLREISRAQTLAFVQINKVYARLEKIEQNPPLALPTESLKKGGHPSKIRAPSPPAELHKKQQKSAEKECNTPNIIMESQDSNPSKQIELRPRCGCTAN